MISLPSLQALDHPQAPRIWLAAEAKDLLCGFDRLAERVRSVIGQDPSGNGLFVFRSRRGDSEDSDVRSGRICVVVQAA